MPCCSSGRSPIKAAGAIISRAWLDKAAAISPLLAVVALEAYWVAVGSWAELSWRHHAAALLWSSFALTDFFATDTTNQRLRAQQSAGDEDAS